MKSFSIEVPQSFAVRGRLDIEPCISGWHYQFLVSYNGEPICTLSLENGIYRVTEGVSLEIEDINFISDRILEHQQNEQ